MDTVPQNSTHHFPPSSRDTRFQPQEVQQVSHSPTYPISPPTHGKYSPPAVRELGSDDLVDVLNELLDASSNWENIGLGLRLSPGILQALKGPYKLPWDCLRDMLREWLNRSPDPSWQSLIRVLRSPIVGKDTLANHLEAKYLTQEGSVSPSGPLIAAPSHPSTVCIQLGQRYPDQLDLFANYLRETYEVQIPDFRALQWPPPSTRKVFNLSLIHSETIRCTAPNDELVRLLMTGCVPEYVRRNTSVELKDLFGLQSQGRKFVLIEGAPGSGT